MFIIISYFVYKSRVAVDHLVGPRSQVFSLNIKEKDIKQEVVLGIRISKKDKDGIPLGFLAIVIKCYFAHYECR
jgi:hypothetical protein